MVGMLLFTRVANGKRQELVQAFNALIAEERIRPCRRLVMEDVNDQSVVCWLGYWREQEALDAFVASETFRALKGAAEVLGTLQSIELIASQSLAY